MTCKSGNAELDLKIKDWLSWDKNKTTLAEIESLVSQQKWKDLADRLLTRLAFGTAGLRGRMQGGFNYMNDLVVIQTAQGIAKYLLESPSTANEVRYQGIVLGYDGRHNSKRFAELSAAVFLAEGFKVYLFGKMVPTPFVSFCVKEKKASAGIMVTASHNPKEDNGYKVYWGNSAQIVSPHDKNIQNHILKNLKPLESSWQIPARDKVIDAFEEIRSHYYSQLVSQIPAPFLELNSRSKSQYVYSAMHGVGYPFVVESFEYSKLPKLETVEEQKDPDPEFRTVKFPNPEEGKSSLELSIKLANEKGISVILANDPDADRLACAEKNPKSGVWRVFSGNELGALFGWWALQCYKAQGGADLENCYMLASTVSSKILRAMAQKEGFHFEETLTGFKWMGNRAIELEAEGKKVLFAFEEAIGFMVSTTVLDKDGVSAAAHLATLYNYLAEKGVNLSQKLDQIYEEYGFHFTLVSYYLCYDPEKTRRIFDRIRTLENGLHPKAVNDGRYKIRNVRDLTTGVDTSRPDGKATLPTSKSSQMITFTFENGVVLTLRTSGTEPKIKYYGEMCAAPGETDWEKLKDTLRDVVKYVCEELLQPELNELKPKSD